MLNAKLQKYFSAHIIFLVILTFSLSANEKEVVESSYFQANPIIAEINGKRIRFEDLRDKAAQDAAQALYDQLARLLPILVLNELAKFDPKIDPNPKFTVSDDMITLFYKQNRLENRGSIDALRPQIRDYLAKQLQLESLDRQYNKAKSEGLVKSYLEAPSEFLLETNVGKSYIRGNKNAKVIVLEYSDYQCPFCARVQSTLTQLIKDYGDRVAFGYRHFPLPFHKEADEAAIAVECARDQGKFEALHSLLFENQKNQFVKDLISYAEDIGVEDAEKYEKCIQEEKYRPRVLADMKAGQEAGVTGTPGFFIGTFESETGKIQGKFLSGARPIQDFKQILDKYLARQS
jgi:protein-disulfide isomerase